MKKLLVCLFILNGFACFAQEKALTWDYPVKPGMEEWTKFESRPEMAEACLIPDSIIKNISTSDLLELCLNYPLLHDIMFYNFPQMGQILKEKKTKLQNTRYCIQTSGWKEGIYYVHVNLNGLVKTGILVVAK